MNALPTAITWWIIQATALTFATALMYFAARRRGPLAGRLIGLTGLFLLAPLAVASLGPWPGVWRMAVGPSADNEAAARDERSGHIRGPATRDAAAASLVEGSAAPRLRTAADLDSSPANAWRAFMTTLAEGPLDAGADAPTRAWNWRWALAAFVGVAVLVGVLRLAFGLWAIRRYRAQTAPIDDDELLAEAAELAGRLNCMRPFTLLEGPDAAGAATIGWRRPAIVLARTWRCWSPSERRAVLAHELAHVAREDFLASVAAQACVALYFFHPLVHWLARAMRMEQELAADQAAARAMSGAREYLTVLAHMALDADQPRVAWAARCFLPTQGTLLRRIEMLRSPRCLCGEGLSPFRRAALVGTLAAMAIALGGIRPPYKAAAQDRAERGEATTTPAEARPSTDGLLEYLPEKPIVVVSLTTGSTRESKERAADWEKVFELARLLNPALSSFRLAEIEQLAFGVDVGPDSKPRYRLAWRTNVPAQERLLASADRQEVGSSSPAQNAIGLTAVEGTAGLYRIAATREWLAIVGEDIVLVGSDVDDVRTAMHGAPKRSAARWMSAWESRSGAQVRALVDIERIRNAVVPTMSPHDRELFNGPSPLAMALGPLLTDADYVVAGLDLEPHAALSGVVGCPNSSVAESVSKTIGALAVMGQNALPLLQKAADSPAALAAVAPLTAAVNEALTSVSAKAAGPNVDFSAESKSLRLPPMQFLTPAIEAAHSASQRTESMNDLKVLALAMHVYHDSHKRFPPAIVMGPDGKTTHSWRVELLPILEEIAPERCPGELSQRYRLDEPWDSEHNRALIAEMPPVFAATPQDVAEGTTAYFAVIGPTTVFESSGDGRNPEGLRIAEIPDGTSNTIMLVEAKRAVPWTKPEDIVFDPSGVLPRLGGHHKDGFLAAFCDGSVHFIGDAADPELIRKLITRGGNEPVQLR